MAIHLWPPVTRRLMRPTRGLGSAPLPRSGRPVRVAPSYLALLRVEFAAFHSAIRPEGRATASSLWHWSSSHDGRALPATLRCGARTFLTVPAGHPTDLARPSDRLADRAILPCPRRPAVATSVGDRGRRSAARRAPHDRGRPARVGAVDRLVRQRVGDAVLGPRHVRGRPAREPAQRPAGRRPQRMELRILDPPPTVELLHDELGVEEQVDLSAPSRWPARAPGPCRCTRPRCWSGRRGTRRSWRPGGAAGRAHPPGPGRSAPRPSDAGPGCRVPPRRCG